jgi:hypothetical protein
MYASDNLEHNDSAAIAILSWDCSPQQAGTGEVLDLSKGNLAQNGGAQHRYQRVSVIARLLLKT